MAVLTESDYEAIVQCVTSVPVRTAVTVLHRSPFEELLHNERVLLLE